MNPLGNYFVNITIAISDSDNIEKVYNNVNNLVSFIPDNSVTLETDILEIAFDELAVLLRRSLR